MVDAPALDANTTLTSTVLITSVAPRSAVVTALRVVRRTGFFMVCRLSLKSCWWPAEGETRGEPDGNGVDARRRRRSTREKAAPSTTRTARTMPSTTGKSDVWVVATDLPVPDACAEPAGVPRPGDDVASEAGVAPTAAPLPCPDAVVVGVAAGEDAGAAARRRGRRGRRQQDTLDRHRGARGAVHRRTPDRLPGVAGHLNVERRVRRLVRLVARGAQVHAELQEPVPPRWVCLDDALQRLVAVGRRRHWIGRVGIARRGGQLGPAPVARRKTLLRLVHHEIRRAAGIVVGRLRGLGGHGAPRKGRRTDAAAGDLLAGLVAQADGADRVRVRVRDGRSGRARGARERCPEGLRQSPRGGEQCEASPARHRVLRSRERSPRRALMRAPRPSGSRSPSWCDRTSRDQGPASLRLPQDHRRASPARGSG